MIKKILVTGANGFLGKKLFDEFGKKFTVSGIDIDNEFNPRVEMIDITDSGAVDGFVKKEAPDLIVHAAAISDVGACAKEPEKAWLVNHRGTLNLARTAREVNARLVFTSSLNVYQGTKGNYSEKDETKPVNIYGQTKLKAEEEVLKIDSQNIVLRVGTLYGYNGSLEGMTMASLNDLGKDQEVVGLTDAIRNFSWIDDFPSLILTLVSASRGGVYNAGGFEKHSDYEFLKNLAAVFGFNSALVKADLSPPHVAKKATMNMTKIKSLGARMTSLKRGLQLVKEQLGYDV